MAGRQAAPDVTAIPLGRPSPGASSDQPERSGPRTGPEAPKRPASLLFDLAPGGACRAADVAADAVRSCRTLSPLPTPRLSPRGGRFAFCGAVPGVAPAGRYPAPCPHGARTFLRPRETRKATAVRPTGLSQGHRLAERSGSRALANPPRRERRRKLSFGFARPVPPRRDVVGGGGAFGSGPRRASGRIATTAFACGFHATHGRRVR